LKAEIAMGISCTGLMLALSGDIYYLTELSPEDRPDRAKVNEAVRRHRESRSATPKPHWPP